MSAEFTPKVHAILTERSNGVCEVCDAARAWDAHHRRPRGMGGTRRADSATPAAGLHVCRACHNLLESHRDLAKLLGWLVPSTGSPAATPVLRRGQWVLLDDDGGITQEVA